jgi:hypothetical protein
MKKESLKPKTKKDSNKIKINLKTIDSTSENINST